MERRRSAARVSCVVCSSSFPSPSSSPPSAAAFVQPWDVICPCCARVDLATVNLFQHNALIASLAETEVILSTELFRRAIRFCVDSVDTRFREMNHVPFILP
ncbi:hypothetical protein BJX70DRAFT_79603 [Aspergillus crustosus]